MIVMFRFNTKLYFPKSSSFVKTKKQINVEIKFYST